MPTLRKNTGLPLMLNLLSAMDQYINRFKSSVGDLEYYRKGMFLSEGFAFCAIASALGVKRII